RSAGGAVGLLAAKPRQLRACPLHPRRRVTPPRVNQQRPGRRRRTPSKPASPSYHERNAMFDTDRSHRRSIRGVLVATALAAATVALSAAASAATLTIAAIAPPRPSIRLRRSTASRASGFPTSPTPRLSGVRPMATIINSRYVYVKNLHYWDPSAQKWDKVVIKIISDSNAMLSALKTGQVQVAEGAATAAAAAEAAGLKVLSAPSAMLGVYIGDIDGKIVPALKDVRVRQALNFAIDRKGIVASLYGKYGKPTTQSVPQGIGGYLPKLEDVYPYDPNKAKALLAEAGYKNRFKFTLIEQPAVSSGDLLAQAMVANWKDAGIDVTLKPTDSFATYVPLMVSQKYPATTLTFQYSVQLTDTQQLVTKPARYNYMGFTDEKA